MTIGRTSAQGISHELAAQAYPQDRDARLDEVANPGLFIIEPRMQVDVVGAHGSAQDYGPVEVGPGHRVALLKVKAFDNCPCLMQRVIQAVGGLGAVIDHGNSHESGDSTAADRMPTWIGTSGIGTSGNAAGKRVRRDSGAFQDRFGQSQGPLRRR